MGKFFLRRQRQYIIVQYINNLCTNFEENSLTRSQVMKGSQN